MATQQAVGKRQVLVSVPQNHGANVILHQHSTIIQGEVNCTRMTTGQTALQF